MQSFGCDFGVPEPTWGSNISRKAIESFRGEWHYQG